jgi:DNA-directed RNA polymerase subunit E'/Rpb7
MISNTKKNKSKNIKNKLNEGIDVTNIITNNNENIVEINKIVSDKINKKNLVSPYVSIELTTRLELNANQINNEIYYNLKQNLIKRVEDKCNNIGYVVNIEKILDYTMGYMVAEDFTGACYYKVRYQALMCIPIQNTIIIGIISKKIDSAKFMIIQHGPIDIICKLTEIDINNNNFKLENNIIYSKNSKKNISEGDYVKIIITSIRFQNDDKQIKCIGILEDIAIDEEINKYYEKINKKNNDDYDNIEPDNIEYNEDDMIKEDNINKISNTISTNYVDI